MRASISSGDLVFFRARSIWGKLISHYTGSPFSHVGIAVWVWWPAGTPRLQLLEATEGAGVRWRALSMAGPFDLIRTGGAWTDAAEVIARRTVGYARYDVSDLLQRVIGGNPSRNGKWYCSEYAGRMLHACGHRIKSTDARDPGSLERWAMRQGFEHVMIEGDRDGP